MNLKSIKFTFILISISFFSSMCFSQKRAGKDSESTSLEILSSDKISIRAIAIDNDKVWYADNSGKFGFVDLKTNSKFEDTILKDSLKIEFRSIAFTSDAVFVLSIGNPALLYKISKDGKSVKLVYEEKHEKVFYDSMQFRDDKNGMAIGDPTADCFSIITTNDGGLTWTKMSCENLPKLEEGEAAFAASNTNLIVNGKESWIVSGGKKARVFYSSDLGKSWKVSETPIIQGGEMTGVFTADFYDSKVGIIAGGDYEKQNQNFGNKATTSDGGKTWKLVSENSGFGYASCVQYAPESKGEKIICAAGNGIFYSENFGESWKKISDETEIYTIRFKNKTTAVGAGRNKIIKIKLKK